MQVIGCAGEASGLLECRISCWTNGAPTLGARVTPHPHRTVAHFTPNTAGAHELNDLINMLQYDTHHTTQVLDLGLVVLLAPGVDLARPWANAPLPNGGDTPTVQGQRSRPAFMSPTVSSARAFVKSRSRARSESPARGRQGGATSSRARSASPAASVTSHYAEATPARTQSTLQCHASPADANPCHGLVRCAGGIGSRL